jgi:hypothetical protein
MQCTNLSCSPGSLRVRHHNVEMVGMAGKIKGKEYAVGKSKNGRTDAMHLLAIKLSINSSERCSSCKFNGSKLDIPLDKHWCGRCQVVVDIRLFRFALVISFRRAGPSNGFSNSNAHRRSSETLIHAP